MAIANGKNRFVVDLGSMELGQGGQAEVAASIQGAVLTYLALNHKVPSQAIKLLDETGVQGMFVPEPEEKKKIGQKKP